MNRAGEIPPPEWSRYLKRIYYDARQPWSFQSFDKLRQTTRKEGLYHLGEKRLRRWLQNETPYSRNKLYLPKRIKRSRVIVEGLYDQFDADLADYQQLKEENDGIRFLLLVIDVFSRRIWVEPLKTKENVNVLKAFEKIFQQGFIPRRLRTDQGGEFKAKIMKEFYKHYNITHFVSMNDVKANYAERAIKTIKSKLGRFMTFHQTGRYIDSLQDIIYSYNNTKHKSIGMTPREVSKDNEDSLKWIQYRPRDSYNPRGRRLPQFQFQVGENVRIPHLSTAFAREYRERWTEEIFTIAERYRRDGVNIYKLEDKKKETILGTFYEGELQSVLGNQKKQWIVERIVKDRGYGREREALVKFKGWPEYYNRWVSYARAQKDLDIQEG